jgi:hypothetical protein
VTENSREEAQELLDKLQAEKRDSKRSELS